MIPDLAVWTVSGRARPDDDTKHDPLPICVIAIFQTIIVLVENG